jgi:hypothetical protein
MGRKKEIFGQHIITYNGVLCPPPNSNVIVGTMARVICTCGGIVQSTTWRLHTTRKACIEYHKLIGTIPSFKFTSGRVVDTQEN